MQLVSLTSLIPDAILDIRYATGNNIAGRVLYDAAQPELEIVAAEQLVEAAEAFRAQGLRIVIWDGYRTPEVQRQLRAVNSDDHYVLEDSKHCEGLAIDLTLARPDGRYLDMGTDYDDFTPRAHADATELTDEQRANRALLAGTMQSCGFTQWPYEWWHFDYQLPPGSP